MVGGQRPDFGGRGRLSAPMSRSISALQLIGRASSLRATWPSHSQHAHLGFQHSIALHQDSILTLNSDTSRSNGAI
jgi:hypothetical protein